MSNMFAVGNILGSPRAEADSAMLSQAFIETAELRALVETQDFNYVVGRRGAGKSALFERIKQHFESQPQYFTLAAKPSEHEILSIQKLLSDSGASYNDMRAVARVAWKVHLLFWALKKGMGNYKAIKAHSFSKLQKKLGDNRPLFRTKHSAVSRTSLK